MLYSLTLFPQQKYNIVRSVTLMLISHPLEVADFPQISRCGTEEFHSNVKTRWLSLGETGVVDNHPIVPG